MNDLNKEFKPTSWSISNRTAIWVMTAILTLAGISSYNSLPKEKFPDIVVPTISIQTFYRGASPSDIENIITKPIEKWIKTVKGVKKLTSSSIQNVSIIVVEFGTERKVRECKDDVKDAYDKAKNDLPKNDANLQEAVIKEFDFSEMPIMNVNLAGDYDLAKLKNYAEDLKDLIEAKPQFTRVDIVGALDREIKVNLDKAKMEAANITMFDMMQAIGNENVTIPGGNIKMDELNRSVSVKGQFKNPMEIENLVVRSGSGATIYIKDFATVVDGYHDRESYSRLGKQNVVSLNIIKKPGENLIQSSDVVRKIVETFQKDKLPKDVKVTITGDQSKQTRVTIHDLINTIVIGFILVTLILMFFMGATNAIFVGLSVPFSCFLAFLVFPSIGFTLNMIVLFAFLLALGIVVDDAIVVIENTHRIYDNGKVSPVKAAKYAAGEVFLPVFSGTLTTLAPFIPLAFWPGIIGKFMYFLPITLIVTLLASLVVAYTLNPVFAVQFMKPHHEGDEATPKQKRSRRIGMILFGAIALIGYLGSNFFLGNLVVVVYLLVLFHRLVLKRVIDTFQNKTWPRVQDAYARALVRLLKGKRPVLLLVGTFVLLIVTFMLVGNAGLKIVFFPKSEPNFVNVFINTPIGTDITYTDSLARIVNERVEKVVYPAGKENPIIESVISNVAKGANDPGDPDQSPGSHKARVSVAFVEFAKRNGESTSAYLDKVREAIKGIPGCEITVSQEQAGPPTGKPVSIEIIGDDLAELTVTGKRMKRYIDSLQIGGIEELKSDLIANKPEVTIEVNRERANREGISSAQIGQQIGGALFGMEVSKFKDANDDYPIIVRMAAYDRDNLDDLLNMKITFRDMNMGGVLRQVPISSVAKIKYENAYGTIRRKNQKRIVTLSSNVLSSYNPNEVVGKVQAALTSFKAPSSVIVRFGGEQEQQAETGAFLGRAMMISLGLMFLIMVIQFNSFSKPIIILFEIIFSIIGVLLGFIIFHMDISIIMTGIGIVALTGIVVRNGILLVEFSDLLMQQGKPLKEAVIEAARTRMTPVLLTASATILGLIPLAVGLNMDFYTLFATGNPHIFFGGDSVAFWGPLSWTMIFGLAFATFLTLILVPALYLLNEKMRERLLGRPRRWKDEE
ncbi:MAG: efflux RND transporter permease subunit [Flavobacteriaceae bacterium]|nr:efflux RND transporter permease subunit [Flavobacteriaceae bacterium]